MTIASFVKWKTPRLKAQIDCPAAGSCEEMRSDGSTLFCFSYLRNYELKASILNYLIRTEGNRKYFSKTKKGRGHPAHPPSLCYSNG
jgi:hypothetical protein